MDATWALNEGGVCTDASERQGLPSYIHIHIYVFLDDGAHNFQQPTVDHLRSNSNCSTGVVGKKKKEIKFLIPKTSQTKAKMKMF